MPSYYEILGISNTAHVNEIKSAFRRLAKLYHPDKNPQGKETFEKILVAYEVLIDETRRQQYDLKLKYSSSVSEANISSSKAKKKQWGFTDEDLRRRQYYQEHYKKQFNEAKNSSGHNSKIYNEYKYILFAAPLAVALFMFIIKGFESPLQNKPESIAEIKNNTSDALKMGDAPYTLYFQKPIYDTASKKIIKFKNPGKLDAIVCLFNKEQKFIRSCFLQSEYYAELSQIPNEELVIKLCFGKNWDSRKQIKETTAFGKFDSAQCFYRFTFSFLKNTGEMVLDEKKLESIDKITEKDFFYKPQ